MIRNEKEYREAKARLDDFNAQIEATRRELAAEGTPENDTELAVEPLQVLMGELEFDLRLYERLRTEGVSAVPCFPSEESGKELIALRIARDWTQRRLAEELGVSEAQVSRDERNDYQGITQERRARILEALGVEERRAYQSKRSSVVIDLPIMHLEAARFVDATPSVGANTVLKREG
jgi:transcriptional regulator with XRE-family HTH domain